MKNKIRKFKLLSDIGCILCFLYMIFYLPFIKYYICIGILGVCLSILMVILDLKMR